MSSEFLHKIIPLLLCAIFVYTVCSPKLGRQDREARLGESIFYLLFGFALAFYDGFFGPGTGSFWVFALTFFLGYNLIKATAYTKVFNLNSSFIATLCFAAGGNIDYRFAIAMALGQIIGGRLGAHLAITKGARLIRPVFLGVVSLTIASLVYKNYANAQMIMALSRHANLALPVLAVAALLASMLIGYFRLIKREKSQTPG